MPSPDDERQTIRIRRTDDLCPPGGEPFNPDHCTTAADMRTRIAALERENAAMKAAFVLNDLNLPDLEGHRKAHLQLIKAAEMMDKYKHTFTLKVVGAIAVFLAGVLVSGGIPLIPLK